MFNNLSLESEFYKTKNRSTQISPQSGMCTFCTEDCSGTCEIALASVLGSQTVYPTTTGNNQIGSEKDYFLDWSNFNINGRVFGASGCTPNSESATIYNVKTECQYGFDNIVKMDLPILLPALIKLNWPDYFGGAAMAGVSCVIGEDAKSKDPALKTEHEKITEFPFLGEILDSFNRYYRGKGQIFVQCNVEDDMMGVAEIAVERYNATAIEFKFGQSAKGVQPAFRLRGYEEAVSCKESGYIVWPDPFAPEIIEANKQGTCPLFYKYLRLPFWTADYLKKKIRNLKESGAKNFAFKMAGYDPADIETVLRMAIECGIDLVTFDGAGGGSGYSPRHMMNQWGLPVVPMQKQINDICNRLTAEGFRIPAIIITGGFATESQVFKSLALGGKNTIGVGICRAAMAAAMTSKKIAGECDSGESPFAELPNLRYIYGREADTFSPGAIGVYSYLNKIGFGLRHLSALNRKFDLNLLDSSDLIPLTDSAEKML